MAAVQRGTGAGGAASAASRLRLADAAVDRLLLPQTGNRSPQMFDHNKLEALRQKYRDARETEVAPERFRAPLNHILGAAYRRPMPYAGIPTLLDEPYRPEAAELPDFAGLDVALIGVPMDLGVTNRPGARFGPRALPGGRYRRRADALALQPRPVDRGHRGILSAGVSRRRAAGLGRRRPFGELPDPRRARRRAAAGSGPYRRPLRHDGRHRRHEIPPWRAVPPGGIGRGARSRAHDPDRDPRRGGDFLGVLLRFGNDGVAHRGRRPPRYRRGHRAGQSRGRRRPDLYLLRCRWA